MCPHYTIDDMTFYILIVSKKKTLNKDILIPLYSEKSQNKKQLETSALSPRNVYYQNKYSPVYVCISLEQEVLFRLRLPLVIGKKPIFHTYFL